MSVTSLGMGVNFYVLIKYTMAELFPGILTFLTPITAKKAALY